MQQVRAFVRDPANHVASATYFNSIDTPELAHDLLRTDTWLPTAAQEFSRSAAR